MFIQVLQIIICLFLIIAVFLVTKFILIYKPKIFISDSKIKYILNNSDLRHLNRYGKELNDFDFKTNGVFYTKTKWSSKNNNYCKFKGRYYIIEPGYYYVVNDEVEYFVEKATVIFKKKLNR